MKQAARWIAAVTVVVIGGSLWFWYSLQPGSVWAQAFIVFIGVLATVTFLGLARQPKEKRTTIAKENQSALLRTMIFSTILLLGIVMTIIVILVTAKGLFS